MIDPNGPASVYDDNLSTVSPGTIGRAFNYNRSYFNRLISDAITSLTEYIQRRRIHEAKECC